MKTLLRKIATAALGLSFILLAQTSLKAQVGEALNFDGSNDYIQRTETNFSTNDLTIELWVKPASFTNQAYLVTNRTNEFTGSGYWYLFGIQQSSGLLEFVGGTGGFAGGWGVTSAVSLTTGVWQHIAAVRKGTELSIYINGVLKATGIDPYGIHDLTSQSGNNTTYLGAWGPPLGQRYFSGDMDEVRIWSAARTQCQIQTYMKAEIPTSATSLSANYHFNQGTASGTNTAVTSLTTSTGSDNGTLNNFNLTGGSSNWVTPGAVAAGYTTTSAPSASILVTGNSNSLTPGSSSTSTLNFTNFGTLPTRTFVIQNTNTGTLNIYPPYFTGLNAGEFTLTVPPALTLAASATTSFVVAFTSTVSGMRSTTMHVRNNDCATGNFSCAIGGTATAEALDFDGSSDKVIIPTGININNQSFTVEFWAKRTSTLTGYAIGQGNSISTNQGLHIGFRPGTVFTFAFYSNDINYTTTATSDGIYHHWACVYDASITGGAKNRFVYLDGVLVASDVSPSAYLNTGPTILGEAGYYPLGYNNPLVGTLDEVRIWGVARSQCEVQQYMRCEITTTASGLIANYHLNQGTPFGSNAGVTTCIDATGNHNGVLNSFNLSGTTSNWVIPGGVITGSVTPAVMTHTLNVKGNGNLILAGSTTPTVSNFTDFGSALTRTLVVQNIGTGTLYLNGGVFSGANASNFSVTTIPSTLLTSGVSSTLVITLTPTVAGTYSAVLSIYSSDCANPTYSFVVTASVSPAAALNFDGGNDYVSIARPLPLTDFTNELWFKTSNSNSGLLVSTDAGAIGSVSYWDKSLFLSGGNLTAYLWTSGPTETIATSGTNFADGNWHHVAHVVSAAGQKLYVDGLLRASGTLTTSGFSNSHVILGNAIYGSSSYLNGQIDEVRFWHVARSQCEIQTYMNCEIPGFVSNILSNYHFNQGVPSGANTSVTSLIDATGSVNGSLSGFALTTGSVSNWVTPGGVVSNFTTPSVPQGTLNVTGNSVYIPNNSMSPLVSNATNFGSATSTTLSVTNIAISHIYVNNIVFSGANASNFSVTTPPAGTIIAGGSNSFVISFTPTAAGSQSTIVKIYSNDCTYPTYSFAITASTTPAAALNFDGISTSVSTPTLPAFAFTNEATVEAWFRTTASSNAEIVGALHEFNNVGLEMQLTNTGKFEMHAHLGYWANYQWNTGPSFNDGLWHHAAIVVKDDRVTGYVDGILAGSITGTANLNTGDMGVYIGRHPSNLLPFSGDIDEVRVWNVARTQCQIQSYKNCEIPATAPGLISNYHFNQGLPAGSNTAVTTLSDAASGITGTLNNFTLTGFTSNWITPGGVVSGYTVASPPTASISLSGNANTIPNNLPAASTSTLNSTAFTSAGTATFVITNSNTGTLNIGTPYVSGANASEFSITVLPSSTLSASGTSSFVVAFTPTAGGVRNATVNIYSNDCNIPIFSYAISGHATFAEALSIDGADDQANRPILSNNTSNVTLQAKVYWHGSTGINQMIIYNGNSSSNGYGIYNSTGSGNLQILLGGVSFNPFNYTLTPNVWTALSLVLRNGMAECYVNGVLTNVVNPGTPGVPTGSFTIGNNSNILIPEGFNGKLDEVRFWNKALSQCEIQTYLDCEIPGAMPNLLGNYHLNQGAVGLDNTSITTATDASGNSNDLTLSGFALTGTVSNWTSPGAVVSGYTITTPPSASISLTGNTNVIPNNLPVGSTSTVNFTDFGTSYTRTYIITNSNSGTLNIGSPYITGTNASEFSITTLPSSTLSASATTSFVIAFTPTAGGVKSATLNIINNDCSVPIFNFAMTATVPVAAALDFDGVDDYIDVPSNNIPTGNNDFTYEFWVKLKSAQTGHRWISSLGSTATGSLLTIGFDGSNSNKIRIHHYGPDLSANTASITPNVWTHVAVNYRGSNFSSDIFINGSYIETINFGVAMNIPANPVFQIGTFTSLGTYCHNMELDEFRVWNRALCQNEIQNNMNCEIATTATGLVANYHFNQGYSAVDNTAVTGVTDASGSANTGILSGFASAGSVSNWVAPGAVTSGSSCSVYLDPEINVLGNSVSIPSGASTPTVSNFTDFGALCSNTLTVRSFSIQNTGTGVLSIPSFSMSGPDAALFTIGALSPVSPIAAGGSASFNVTLTPLSSGVKTATLNIASNDCDEAAYTFVLSGTSNTLPVVSALTSHSVICNTASTSVSGGGADTYTWTGVIPVINGAPFNPSVTATYSVAGTNTLTGCTNTNNAVVSITVNSLPTVSISVPGSSICPGNSATLIASGGDTYTWTPGPLNTTTINPTPSSNTTYTLVGTNALTGCTSTNLAVQTISITAPPTVSISATSSSICAGTQATLIASGANTYSWSPGNLTTTTVNPQPSATTVYSLIGVSATGCTSSNTATLSITVNALPTVSISTTSSAICVGASATLSASGAVNYSWSPGTATTSSIAISPANTGTYSLVGIDASGCTSTNAPVFTITVNALPTVTAGTSNSVICNTGTTSLLGSGADTFTWNPSVVNGASISPLSTTNYTVTGTNTLTGCTSTNLAVQTISVITSPTVTANSSTTTVCAGSTVALNAANADTFTWNPGNLSGTSITVTPASTTIYTLTGGSSAGCISVNAPTLQITVNALPVVTASATSMSVCPGNSTSISGQGAVTYTWTGGISDGVSFSPSGSDTYTVSGTDANFCQNTGTIMITVNTLPTLSISTTNSVACEAESVVLTVSGANAYVWSSGQASSTLAITPSVTTTYSVTGADLAGCSNTAVYVQSVSPCPGSITAIATVTDVNCSGKNDGRVVITATHNYANAELSYIWTPDSLCPQRNCSYRDKLGAGRISVMVKVTYTLNNVLVKQDSVLVDSIDIKDENGPCDLRVFTGFSPNGDGNNDTWQIENIQEYPKNKVSVFNRWGVKVFDANGYNNASKSWPTVDEATKVPAGTYFYIIDLGNGSKPIKGWVELIKG